MRKESISDMEDFLNVDEHRLTPRNKLGKHNWFNREFKCNFIKSLDLNSTLTKHKEQDGGCAKEVQNAGTTSYKIRRPSQLE